MSRMRKQSYLCSDYNPVATSYITVETGRENRTNHSMWLDTDLALQLLVSLHWFSRSAAITVQDHVITYLLYFIFPLITTWLSKMEIILWSNPTSK